MRVYSDYVHFSHAYSFADTCYRGSMWAFYRSHCRESALPDYEGADLGDILSPCVINVTNYNTRDMICIKSERTVDWDIICAWILKYYIGGWKSYSGGKDYTCSDFKKQPLCDRNEVSSVVYRYAIHKDAVINLRLFTKKYFLTVTSPYTPSPWSSWSSGNDGGKDSDSAWTVIAAVQYHAHPGNQYVNQTEEFQNEAICPQQYPQNQQLQYIPDQSAYAGYQIHASVCQKETSPDTVAGQQAYLHPHTSVRPPSAPPPPYPGY
ncbi:uncharacterized protein LOC123529112 isoform X2 [Mercenaria mercenaria]|uniref:uncharacterized protein LOC123529112 isoform X2 n=1 Tax=Mercenaria mercenaria TaxID=6596 RepID=UPI00234E3E74|nr:uncharacterized protein LOC123529112 isoform X2 [Mercenaria mercenaria]